jgi:uncharacterized Zn finger protein (UPF0148 family)
LIAGHTPSEVDLLKKYKISADELLRGVQCPECKFLPMERQYGNWYCPSCFAVCKNAHDKAIEDYLMLVKPKITNRECREFLGVESKDLSTSLLQKAGLVRKGSFRDSVYMKK